MSRASTATETEFRTSSQLAGLDGQPRIVDYYEIENTHTDPNLPNTTWQHTAISRKSAF